jgi:hypothetical protein
MFQVALKFGISKAHRHELPSRDPTKQIIKAAGGNGAGSGPPERRARLRHTYPRDWTLKFTRLEHASHVRNFEPLQSWLETAYLKNSPGRKGCSVPNALVPPRREKLL